MPKRRRPPAPDGPKDGAKAGKKAAGAAPEASDSPFAKLAPLRASMLAEERDRAAKAANNPAKRPAPPPPPPAEAEEPETAEESLFQAAMADVAPLAPLAARASLSRPRPKAASEWRTPGPTREDLEVMGVLTDLVSGRAEFDLSFTDEHIEGHVKGFPPPAMDRLRQGLIPYQDHLDVHGLTLGEAEEAIGEFIKKSVGLGRSCLLLIHGRGHRSPDGVPVIKRNLDSLLLHRRVKRHILAFATARPVDGGLGASYILLRSPPPVRKG
jgi:DNA-nicking Smr family endonuclease